MGILDEIIKKKKERLSYAKAKTPLKELTSKIREIERPADFKKAIKRLKPADRIRLIAEIKKASPSRGVIRADFDHVKIASLYKEKADAISVLTEEDFFLGDIKYLADVKKIAGKPVLRKDFIFDEYQIYESRAGGADAILLIERILDRSQAEEYLHMAGELSMSVLSEVHDIDDLEKALAAGADIIGINNRNLDTLKISLDTTFEIKKEIPEGKTVVSESGIKSKEDVLRLEEAGVDAMLIGTALMETEDIGKKIDKLKGV